MGVLFRLPQVLELFKKLNGDCPSLFKADVDSAFRRIPVKPEERWMCGIAFMVKGEVWWAQHLACPFGAVGSVHGWERVGAAVAHVARVALMLPVLRYVDDYFGPSRCHVRVGKSWVGGAPFAALHKDRNSEACLEVLRTASAGATWD